MRKDKSVSNAVLRKLGLGFAIATLGLAGIMSAPVAAQMYSKGYEFLKAVDDRDGDTATDMLNEPGTTIVNSRDLTTGETGLHIVVKRSDTKWVKFLLQRGADPNIRDAKGIAPIQLAASMGQIETIEQLIKKGAQVDVSDRTGETPLIAAVHKRDIAVIRLLLANGANPDRNDNSGRSARDYADLMNSNSLILAEFSKADEDRSKKGTDQSYGPSF